MSRRVRRPAAEEDAGPTTRRVLSGAQCRASRVIRFTGVSRSAGVVVECQQHFQCVFDAEHRERIAVLVGGRDNLTVPNELLHGADVVETGYQHIIRSPGGLQRGDRAECHVVIGARSGLHVRVLADDRGHDLIRSSRFPLTGLGRHNTQAGRLDRIQEPVAALDAIEGVGCAFDNRHGIAALQPSRHRVADRARSRPFVGPNNRNGARAVGEVVARRLKAGDPVAIVEGAPNAFNGIQRREGFMDAVQAAGLRVVASQTGQWETARANQVVAAIVSEHPDVKAVLCANDNMALGAVAALKAAGRANDVLVAGFDNISAVQQLVRDGQIIATADQHGDALAVYGIDIALEMLRHPRTTPADRETPVDLITREALH